jgi:hypothetical protein
VPLPRIERFVRRPVIVQCTVSNMATVRAFEVLSNKLSGVHITGSEFVEVTAVGLQSAPTLSSAVSITQEKYEHFVVDFVYIRYVNI